MQCQSLENQNSKSLEKCCGGKFQLRQSQLIRGQSRKRLAHSLVDTDLIKGAEGGSGARRRLNGVIKNIWGGEEGESRAMGRETAIRGSKGTLGFVRKVTFSARNSIWNGLFSPVWVIGSLLQLLCASRPSKNLFELNYNLNDVPFSSVHCDVSWWE